MRFVKNRGFIRIRCIVAGLFIAFTFSVSKVAQAQEKPPRPIIVVATAQNLSFGAFTQGISGGSVIINSAGSRSTTGDVVPLGLGYSYSTALFQITANSGTVITVGFGGPVLLHSGGSTLTLNINSSNPVSPFVTSLPVTDLNVGGTLIVGNPLANPPGNYSGTFTVTFMQQ
jgi:hypothetical protein